MLIRLFRREDFTGELYVDGHWFCPTIENPEKAIPAEWYRVRVTMSPHFKRLLPILDFVIGRTGIRIHRGTKPEHSQGCILVPPEKEARLTQIILDAQRRKDETYIEINGVSRNQQD